MRVTLLTEVVVASRCELEPVWVSAGVCIWGAVYGRARNLALRGGAASTPSLLRGALLSVGGRAGWWLQGARVGVGLALLLSQACGQCLGGGACAARL